MKRITSIQLENSRAFYDRYDPIIIPEGENVLIYGENGSGKSSLYKTLKDFFSSSRDSAINFQRNHHNLANEGSVRIVFSDYDLTTNVIIAGSEQELIFGSDVSNHNVNFVQDSDLIKGFLDYRNLLDVYNHKEPKANLFKLIVKELLLDYIPTGAPYPLGKKFIELEETLYNAYHRNVKSHREALVELQTFNAILLDWLKKIFLRLNYLLIKYFQLNLRVGFVLQTINYNYEKGNWHPTQDLRLDLKQNGINIDDHREVLNEARLSALSVCLYLSAILENPALFEFKILFLDDVFLGLDSGNRIPIANILINEFNDYQIFISTYDRYWYELAQRHFKSHTPNKWKSFEMYLKPEKVGNKPFEKPLIIPYENNFDKAAYHLHNIENPDYPAAANYFRKFAEEILTLHLPDHEIRYVEDYSLIESHKLGKLVKAALHFLSRTNFNNSLLLKLESSLPTLLHPLSHFELSAPIYKKELIDVQKLLLELESFFKELENNYKIFIPEGRDILLNFMISPTETGHYKIKTKETIYLIEDSVGTINISKGKIHYNTTYKILGGIQQPKIHFPKIECKSIEQAYNTIYAFIVAQPGYAHLIKATNYKNEFSYHNSDGNLTLEHHIAINSW